jgi:hypothetical protein
VEVNTRSVFKKVTTVLAFASKGPNTGARISMTVEDQAAPGVELFADRLRGFIYGSRDSMIDSHACGLAGLNGQEF